MRTRRRPTAAAVLGAAAALVLGLAAIGTVVLLDRVPAADDVAVVERQVP